MPDAYQAIFDPLILDIGLDPGSDCLLLKRDGGSEGKAYACLAVEAPDLETQEARGEWIAALEPLISDRLAPGGCLLIVASTRGIKYSSGHIYNDPCSIRKKGGF